MTMTETAAQDRQIRDMMADLMGHGYRAVEVMSPAGRTFWNVTTALVGETKPTVHRCENRHEILAYPDGLSWFASRQEAQTVIKLRRLH